MTCHAVSACQHFFFPWASIVLLKMYIKNNNFPLITSAVVLKNTFILTKYNLLWKIFTLVKPYRESLICFQTRTTTTRVLWKLIFTWANILPLCPVCWAFLSSSDNKESACNLGDSGSIPGSGRKWLPSLVFLPEQFQGQRSLMVQHFYLCAQIHDKVHQQTKAPYFIRKITCLV